MGILRIYLDEEKNGYYNITTLYMAMYYLPIIVYIVFIGEKLNI